MANDPITVLNHVLITGPNYVGLKLGHAALILSADGTIQITGNVKVAGNLDVQGLTVDISAGLTLRMSGPDVRVESFDTCEITSIGDAKLHSGKTLRVSGGRELDLRSKGQTVRTTAP
jgi:hypothetical protein